MTSKTTTTPATNATATPATTATTTATTNANAQAQAQVQAQAQQDAQVVEAVKDETKNEDTEMITATITKVMIPEGEDERVSFVLDKEFDTIDFKTGEEKRTNVFGLNIYAVVNQAAKFVSYIQLADALAMGKMINPQIISLSMIGARVTIKRESHNEGEQRKNTNGVYARDCITSEFVEIKPNIKPVFEQMLMQIIATAPAIVKTPAIPNPFGM